MIGEIGDPSLPIELHSVRVGDGGTLAAREPKFPLTFRFGWRNSEFEGEIGRGDDGLYLRLCAAVANVPYTAENASGRSRLLGVVTSPAESGIGTLRLMDDQSVVLSKEVALPLKEGLTASGLVTQISVIVLALAPYLDLLAELRAA